MSAGLNYAADLFSGARNQRGLSYQTLATQTDVSVKALNNFELAQATPQSITRTKIERYFGWPQGIISQLIASDKPWEIISFDDLTEQLPEAQLTDERLLWELTHRMQTKDDQLQEAQDRIRELEAELQKYKE